jgi:hypothetical protein
VRVLPPEAALPPCAPLPPCGDKRPRAVGPLVLRSVLPLAAASAPTRAAGGSAAVPSLAARRDTPVPPLAAASDAPVPAPARAAGGAAPVRAFVAPQRWDTPRPRVGVPLWLLAVPPLAAASDAPVPAPARAAGGSAPYAPSTPRGDGTLRVRAWGGRCGSGRYRDWPPPATRPPPRALPCGNETVGGLAPGDYPAVAAALAATREREQRE